MRVLSIDDERLGEAVAVSLLPAGAADWPYWLRKTLRAGLANFDTDSPAAVAHTAAVLWQRETGADGADAWIDELAAIATGRTEQPTEPRFKLLTAAVIAALPPMEWRIRGVLPKTGIGAVYGLPGCGKSFLALDTLGAIAAGRAWFSHAVTPAPCVYLGLEGEAGVGQRIQAYTARLPHHLMRGDARARPRRQREPRQGPAWR